MEKRLFESLFPKSSRLSPLCSVKAPDAVTFDFLLECLQDWGSFVVFIMLILPSWPYVIPGVSIATRFLNQCRKGKDFYGLALWIKIFLVINAFGEIMNAFLTLANVADNHLATMIKLFSKLKGWAFAVKRFIEQKAVEKLYPLVGGSFAKKTAIASKYDPDIVLAFAKNSYASVQEMCYNFYKKLSKIMVIKQSSESIQNAISISFNRSPANSLTLI